MLLAVFGFPETKDKLIHDKTPAMSIARTSTTPLLFIYVQAN
tara:strand:- start:279 stop:404 length:126 start_codon:yes stop_codon:yes gene_type:complete